MKVLGVVENMAAHTVSLSSLLGPSCGVRFAGEGGGDVTAEIVDLIRSKFGDGVSVNVDAFPTASEGVEGMCERYGVEHLGRIELDPEVGKCTEEGRGYGDGEGKGSEVVGQIAERLVEMLPVAEE